VNELPVPAIAPPVAVVYQYGVLPAEDVAFKVTSPAPHLAAGVVAVTEFVKATRNRC
jgi:hypothetical protein